MQPSGAAGTAPDSNATRSPAAQLGHGLALRGRRHPGVDNAADCVLRCTIAGRFVRTPGERGASTPLNQIVGEVVPPSEDQSVAELRARAARVRRLAETFQHDESAPRLRALADDLQARADALDRAAAATVDE
jgi:hypothetical protein